MSKCSIVFLIFASLCSPAKAGEWFNENNALIQVHKHILNDDLPTMFSSLVEVWQDDESKKHKRHLNDLFTQSLNKDCGKSLIQTASPDWINSIKVNRNAIQSPGRQAYKLIIEIESPSKITHVDFTKWVDKEISTDSDFQNVQLGDGNHVLYQKRYDLNNALESGLYRLNIEGEGDKEWSTWIILGEYSIRQQVRWSSKDSWVIDKKRLLNPYCPLPTLEIGLYDYVNGNYKEIWSKIYESDYPSALDHGKFSNERYVLAVSMNHARWQGDIVIEQTQTISKTYDISDEEELK